VEQAIRVKS